MCLWKVLPSVGFRFTRQSESGLIPCKSIVSCHCNLSTEGCGEGVGARDVCVVKCLFDSVCTGNHFIASSSLRVLWRVTASEMCVGGD